jgi:uncharacterized protein (DUF488 family)
LELLQMNGVTAVADVRSNPYSRRNPQFNRETLARSLEESNISYVFVGKELGARSDDPSCYEAGRVQFRRLARTAAFHSGIERVLNGARRYRVALMCAEKEPLDCHRTVLVARALEHAGVPIKHILADGRLEDQKDTMSRLLDLVGLPRDDMFRSREELVTEACGLREQQIAYVDESLAQTDASYSPPRSE